MNYTRALKRYFIIEKKAKKIEEPLMFRNQTEVINTLLTFYNEDNHLKRCSNFEFINFLYDLEFEDEDTNMIIQEIMHNLQKTFKYAGSSVLSAYNSCLWDKYNDIGLTPNLKEEDIKAFETLANNDLSSDIDLFFKDTEDAFIFINVLNFKLHELIKFFEAGKKLLPKGKSKSMGFGGMAKSNSQDIVDFFKYQEPLYKININQSIAKIKSNQGYKNMVQESTNEMVNIKIGLTNRLTDAIESFKDNLALENVPKDIYDYHFTDISAQLFRDVKLDSFSIELNCILPGENARVRDRVPYFDILNCAMIWDFSTKEFNTKYITDSNSYSSDIFSILIKPWEIIFNDKYLKEHFQPMYRGIDKDINHPMDFLELEDELDFSNPEEDIEKLLFIDVDDLKHIKKEKSFFVQSSSKRTIKLMEIFHKMIPENVEMVEVTMKNISYRTYNKISYNEPIIDKLLMRINKYQEKGYLINRQSNFIPILMTSKLDNVFNIFTNDGMIALLGESIEGIAESSQELILSKMEDTNKDNKAHTDKEFRNMAKNLEVLEFMKDTIIKVHELKKNNLFDSCTKKITYQDAEETEF